MTDTHTSAVSYGQSSYATDTAQEQAASRIYLRAASLGFAAGLRTSIPLATLAWTSEEDADASRSWQRFPDAPRFKTFLSYGVVGEIIVDKLPVAGSRLSSAGFIPRLASGALAGIALCRRYHQPVLRGAITGAIGAAFGSLAGYSCRLFLGQVTNTPDFVWAVLEDATAFGISSSAVKKTEILPAT